MRSVECLRVSQQDAHRLQGASLQGRPRRLKAVQAGIGTKKPGQ